MIAMYSHYKPDADAESLAAEAMQKYEGQEEILMEMLVQKYGPEPSE